MRAIQFDSHGGPEVLHEVDVPPPEPSATQILIRVAAAAVNPADFKWRQGLFRETSPLELPHVLGYDVAGTVAAVGAEVGGFRPGDRVVASVFRGYAELAVAEEVAAAPLPEDLDFAAAAALPCAALSGVQLIEEWVKPQAGQTVLVTGATGAVGRFALYAALRLGARVVAAVRPAYFDEARALGAHEVIALEGGDASGLVFDHVADTVGGEAVAVLSRNLAQGGSIITVATTPIPPEGLKATPTFRGFDRNDGARLARIARDVAAGHASMPIARRLPLSAAAEGHRLMEAGGARGKIVLEP